MYCAASRPRPAPTRSAGLDMTQLTGYSTYLKAGLHLFRPSTSLWWDPISLHYHKNWHCHKNYPAKPPDAQIWTVLIVQWSRIPDFGVAWPKSNLGNSWMAKNGFFLFFSTKFLLQTPKILLLRRITNDQNVWFKILLLHLIQADCQKHLTVGTLQYKGLVKKF